MNKLSKAIKAILLIIRKPYLLNYILEDEQVKKQEFIAQFSNSSDLRQIAFTQFLEADQNVIVTPYAFLGGSSLATDMALLQLICRKYQVQDYLEIGTWRGESVANVSPYVQNCYSLNLPDETMAQMGLDKDYIGMHRFFSKNTSNITHLFGHSQEFDFEKLNKKFDLIFVDGDHHTDAVEKDTITALTLLKDEKSILVWHDASSDPETPRYEVLLGIYRAIPKEKHKHIYLVSNTLCAVYYPFEIDFTMPKVNIRPEHFFSIELKVKKNITEKNILLKLLEFTPIYGSLEIYSFDSKAEKLFEGIAIKDKDDYFVSLTEENKKKLIEIIFQFPLENMICHMSFLNPEKENIFLCHDFFATIIISKNIQTNNFLTELLEDGCGVISNEW
ncbi:MAG: class I SAM-dependent methyltransferase [Bacteroidota bacterium]